MVRDLVVRRVDGLILAPSASPDYAIRLADRYGLPVTLMMGNNLQDEFSGVAFTWHAATTTAAAPSPSSSSSSGDGGGYGY